MELSHIEHWLKYALLCWLLVSLVAAPLIGRFLSNNSPGTSSLPFRRKLDHGRRLPGNMTGELPAAMRRRQA
jgi:hypothetical protein